MPTRQVTNEEMARKEVLYVSFNQDCSCIGIGHEDGYMFYSFENIDGPVQIQDGKRISENATVPTSEAPKRICIVERLFRSSLVVLVSMNQTRKLWIYHSQKNNEICANTFGSAILAVKMNRKRIVVCLEDLISIHNVRDMRQLHKITDTPLNPKGIMDLSNDENNACYLAIPGASSTGHVLIFDTDALITTCSFSAHASPLAAIRFNADGTKLATASEKGTVIRVFGIPNGERLYEFSRGVKRCVTISSLAFSADSRYLCLSSNTETVHVFSLVKSEAPQEQIRQDDGSQEGIGGWVNYFSQQASAYLPTHMNELMLREKSVATARLPIIGTKTSVAMTRINDIDYLLVASTEGYLFCYTVDTESGECALIRQYRIGPNAELDESNEQNPIISVRSKGPSGSSSFMPIDSMKDTKSKDTHQNKNTGSAGSSSASSSPQDIGNNAKPIKNSFPLNSGSTAITVGTRKPTPPPIPPAPKKRGDAAVASSASVAATFSVGQPSAKTTKMTSPASAHSISTNPFEMDDNAFEFDDENENQQSHKQNSKMAGAKAKEQRIRKTKVATDDEVDDLMEPLADLNDMEEFPPLAMM